MNKFILLNFILLCALFSQENDSLRLNNRDTLSIQIQNSDSVLIDTIKIVSGADSIIGLQKLETAETNSTLPLIRDPNDRKIERLETGESFFEIKSSIDILLSLIHI